MLLLHHWSLNLSPGGAKQVDPVTARRPHGLFWTSANRGHTLSGEMAADSIVANLQMPRTWQLHSLKPPWVPKAAPGHAKAARPESGKHATLLDFKSPGLRLAMPSSKHRHPACRCDALGVEDEGSPGEPPSGLGLLKLKKFSARHVMRWRV